MKLSRSQEESILNLGKKLASVRIEIYGLIAVIVIFIHWFSRCKGQVSHKYKAMLRILLSML
jgi:hypothetical protein